MINKLLISAIITSLTTIFAGPASALPHKPGVELVPHRAIYDLSLSSSEASSNVADLRGRLVLDFAGSPCEGYTYKSRLVTQMTDQDGGTYMTDMRTSTWEDAEGQEFRFENKEFNGLQQSAVIAGSASRKDDEGRIAVNFKKPVEGSVEFDRHALFPTQHFITILEAAQKGKKIVQADVYDGTEEGNKLFSTTTFIGRPRTPASDKAVVDGISNADHLNTVTSWPVAISFFDTATEGQRDEGLPVYELSFRLFANGVSGDMTLNYGDFLIGGKLTRVDFNTISACVKGKN